MTRRFEGYGEPSLYRSLFALLYMGAVGMVATTDMMNGQQRGLPLEETTWRALQERARIEQRTIHLTLHRGVSSLYDFLCRKVVRDRTFARFFGSCFVNGSVDITSAEGEQVCRLLGVEDTEGSELLHLFITPNGRLLHRYPGRQGSLRLTVARLIDAASHALSSDSQYYTVRDRYLAGDRGDDLLMLYALAAREAGAGEAVRIAEEYHAAVSAAIPPGAPPRADILRRLGIDPLGAVVRHGMESALRGVAETAEPRKPQ